MGKDSGANEPQWQGSTMFFLLHWRISSWKRIFATFCKGSSASRAQEAGMCWVATGTFELGRGILGTELGPEWRMHSIELLEMSSPQLQAVVCTLFEL